MRAVPDPIRLTFSVEPPSDGGVKILGLASSVAAAFTDGAARASQAYSTVEARLADAFAKLATLAGGIGPALAAGMGTSLRAVESQVRSVRVQLSLLNNVPGHPGGSGGGYGGGVHGQGAGAVPGGPGGLGEQVTAQMNIQLQRQA